MVEETAKVRADLVTPVGIRRDETAVAPAAPAKDAGKQ
jgi:hypothetical protein